MNQERKVSVLRNLLERVQKRAAAPRATGTGPVSIASAASVPVSSAVAAPVPGAPPLAISAPPPQPAKTSARPGSSTLPLNFASSAEGSAFRDAVIEPPAIQASSPPAGATVQRGAPSDPEIETEEGPPSAPRLREVAEEEVAAEEREIEEEEPQLKTPPPESGKQHVTPSPAAASEPDDDISITVTMEESEVPPSVSTPSTPDVAISASAPPQRLALVSEPEIELHGMTPLSGPIEPSFPSAVPSGVRPVSPAAPPAAPPQPPVAPAAVPPAAFGRPGSVPDTQPSVSAAPQPAAPPPSAAKESAPTPPAAPPAPPVRLMAQPLADASGKPPPPVEVWSSTFAPAALKGQVASFVGHNANFEPKTFGELVRATIALGEDAL